MVLAAGYGLRLRPLTERVPKPMVPVAGKPMLEYSLDKLREYGAREVVVNVSHLKEQLLAYLPTVPGLHVVISDEPEPLETGGGLKKALPLLGNEAFFTINSDILWTDEPGSAALGRLARHWDDSKMDLLLLVQSRSRANGYDRGQDDLFIHRHNTLEWEEADAPYIIAGVGIAHPRIFANAPDGKFSVKVLWLEALRRGRLFCLPHRGRWYQAGTPEDLKRAEAAFCR
jgi:N-acetyl-alpha-D-muramate 1-phosphate uridylyltransferase